QQQVEDDRVRQLLPGTVERFQAVLRGEHGKALLLQPLDAATQTVGIVVRDQNPAGRALFAHATLGRGEMVTGGGASMGSRGIRKRKTLPRPGALSTQIWPPCNSTSRLDRASPRPTPS